MDISRADGSVIIVADVNSSPAEKKLIQLEKTIEETAAKLDSKQKEKTGIEERLNTAKASRFGDGRGGEQAPGGDRTAERPGVDRPHRALPRRTTRPKCWTEWRQRQRS